MESNFQVQLINVFLQISPCKEVLDRQDLVSEGVGVSPAYFPML